MASRHRSLNSQSTHRMDPSRAQDRSAELAFLMQASLALQQLKSGCWNVALDAFKRKAMHHSRSA